LKELLVPPVTHAQEKLKRLDDLNKLAEFPGGREKVEEQRRKGKLSAKERINLLLDPSSFQELDKLVTHRASDFGLEKIKPFGDGVVTGYGKIRGRLVYVFASDFTVFGGSYGEAHAKKIVKVMDLALKNGAPIIGLNDSGGARIHEGVMSLAGVSEIFFRNTLCSGTVPQLSAILGPCAGASVYSPALTDFIVMVRGISNMFVTGPDVVKAALFEDVTFEELGGADVHACESGVADFVVDSEAQCISLLRKLLSFLPQNNSERPLRIEMGDPVNRREEGLLEIVPEEPNKAYDMRELITRVVDCGDYLEVRANWAKNVTVGFARIDGESIGVVGSQPMFLAGVLDVESSKKAARFVRFCDAFNIPIVTFVDVPGYMPGTEQEHRGLIKEGSKLLFAYCEATVPKVTVIIRKAYGGAYCAMGSKYSKADINYAWPTAEIAVMGPEGATNIIFRKEMAAALSAVERDRIKHNLIHEYKEKFANPYVAASRGIIDEVIYPEETRMKIADALSSLKEKKEFRPPKKHGNIQL
jgi:acetyl-CoA carboxylase carboxyltransferase component